MTQAHKPAGSPGGTGGQFDTTGTGAGSLPPQPANAARMPTDTDVPDAGQVEALSSWAQQQGMDPARLDRIELDTAAGPIVGYAPGNDAITPDAVAGLPSGWRLQRFNNEGGDSDDIDPALVPTDSYSPTLHDIDLLTTRQAPIVGSEPGGGIDADDWGYSGEDASLASDADAFRHGDDDVYDD